MEYVDGQPITDYCRTRNSGIDEILRLFRSVCEAVQFAHSRSITHRDLKPSNILVTTEGVGKDGVVKEGVVKLLDFGIAKQAADDADPADRITQTGLRPMTLAYASPEQIRGDDTTNQTDVYSLGVVLYELLAGALPFDLSKVSQREAERIVLEQEPPPPSAAKRFPVARSDWNDLDVLCLKAMHKDLGRRYGSVEAVIRDVDRYLKGEPLEARPDTLRYRLGKFARRNRRALLATAAALFLIAGLATFFAVRLNQERNATMAEAARTKRIEQFMLNLFDGGDKEAGPAGDLRVVALLDRGVANAKTLNSDPAVQTELYETVGGIYQKLGKFESAEPLLQSALERRKSVNGPQSAEVADGLVAMGMLRYDQGQLPEAERLIREGLALQKKVRDPGDPAISRASFALGKVLEERGSNDEAIRVLDAAVKTESARGQDSADLAFGLANLAGAHFYLGHYAVAEPVELKAVAMDRRIFGAVHPRVADVLLDLGEIEHNLGKLPEMEKHYREALAIKQSWYGKEHPDTALAMIAVGQALYYQGPSRYDEAAAFAQEGVDIQSRLLGKMHPEVAQGLGVLSTMELKRGHLDAAEADFHRVLDIDHAQYGERHYLVGIAWMNLGEVYFVKNQPELGERAYREALASFTEKLPPGHINTAIAHTRLGHALLLEKRYKEAEPELVHGYDLIPKQPNAALERPLTNVRKDLVALYTALHEPAKAARYQAELTPR
jgi:serine/threonine-protein kinase